MRLIKLKLNIHSQKWNTWTKRELYQTPLLTYKPFELRIDRDVQIFHLEQIEMLRKIMEQLDIFQIFDLM